MRSGTCTNLKFSTNASVPFLIYAVISWCGIIAQNLNRRTKPFLFFFVRWENKIKNMNNIEEFEKELEKLAKKIQQEVDECRDADLTDWIKEEIKIFIQKWEA